MNAGGSRGVAVFDGDMHPGVSFARSLGARGVPVTVYSHERAPAAALSRFVGGRVQPAPSPSDTDAFITWLIAKMASEEIDLVAPTSDPVVFAVAMAHEHLGRSLPGHPTSAAVVDCLFKPAFAAAVEATGFPVPPWSLPTDLAAARAAAAAVGYPVVFKLRSHVAAGVARGEVVYRESDFASGFHPYEVAPGHDYACKLDPDLGWAMMQKYYDPERTDVISVSGCIDGDGTVHGVGHSRKVRCWPPRVGVGTLFEALDEQPFTAAAIDVARQVLGVGLFELEVLVDDAGEAIGAIDLNPRAFGQISLEIACGNDLPSYWYDVVNGRRPTPAATAPRPAPYWLKGVPYYTEAAVALAAGPQRRRELRRIIAELRRRRVGAMFEWRDPGPALRHAAKILRHPGGLLRPFVREQRRLRRGDRG